MEKSAVSDSDASPTFSSDVSFTPGPSLSQDRDRHVARACFEKAIRESPDDSYSIHQLGLLFEEEFKDLPAAQECYRKAVAVNNSNFAAWSSLGTSLMLSDPTEALKCFDMALSINDAYCRAHKNRGILLLREARKGTIDSPDKKMMDEALYSLNRARDVDPCNASVLIVLGEAHEALNDMQQAEKLYSAARHADLENTSCYFHLGLLYEKKGNYDLARKNFEAALEKDRCDPGALSKLAKLIEAHFPHEILVAQYALTLASEVAASSGGSSSTKDEVGRWKSLLRRFCERNKLNRAKSSAELSAEIGFVAWIDRAASSSGFDSVPPAEATQLECPQRHTLYRIYKKPRAYGPRCTWACEECKRSIGGSDLAVNGALYCATCKYDLCHGCSKTARVAHLFPDPPRLIGSGAFGTVTREFSPELGIYCAVKRSRFVSTDMEKEVRLMLHFQQHPNVVRLYSSRTCSPSGGIEMWMELMKESVLNRIRREGALHELDARSIIRDALRGLCALHALKPRPVIHRDIKPDNLLIAQDGRTVKLADFGLSKHSAQGGTAQRSEVKGTPQFLAPECFNDTRPIWTPAADMWAIGCSWISMCTGMLPYGSNNLHRLEHMWFHFQQEVRGPCIPGFLSTQAQALIAKCLAIDYKERASANAILNDDYFTASDEKFFVSVEGLESDDQFEQRRPHPMDEHGADLVAESSGGETGDWSLHTLVTEVRLDPTGAYSDSPPQNPKEGAIASSAHEGASRRADSLSPPPSAEILPAATRSALESEGVTSQQRQNESSFGEVARSFSPSQQSSIGEFLFVAMGTLTALTLALIKL